VQRMLKRISADSMRCRSLRGCLSSALPPVSALLPDVQPLRAQLSLQRLLLASVPPPVTTVLQPDPCPCLFQG
jgi:hypothetical protein